MRYLALPALLVGVIGCGGGATSAVDAGPTVPLDTLHATFDINVVAEGTSTTVTALFTNAAGKPVVLQPDQAIAIGATGGVPVPFTGPDPANDQAYTATLPAATSYDIRVDDPVKGPLVSTFKPPAVLVVAAPLAGDTVSVSAGFPVTWGPTETDADTNFTILQGATLILGANELLSNDPGTYTYTGAQLSTVMPGTPMNLIVGVTQTLSGVTGFSEGDVLFQSGAEVSLNPGP